MVSFKLFFLSKWTEHIQFRQKICHIKTDNHSVLYTIPKLANTRPVLIHGTRVGTNTHANVAQCTTLHAPAEGHDDPESNLRNDIRSLISVPLDANTIK